MKGVTETPLKSKPNITESPLKSHIILRILTLLSFVISTKNFLDLNIKLLVVVFILAFTTNATTFQLLGVYISQLVIVARCCTSIIDFYCKNLQITSKLLTQGYRYHKHRIIWKALYINLKAFIRIEWNIVSRICFGRNLSGLLRRSSLQTNEGKMLYELRLVRCDIYWQGLSTRNAHMVHIISQIRLKMVYTS